MTQITYGFADLNQLIDHMMAHLEAAPREAQIAAAMVLSVRPREDLLAAIKEALEDPFFDGHKIAALGSGMLGLDISYEGDSVIYIADPSDPSDSAERAVARLLESLSGTRVPAPSLTSVWP